MKRKFKSNSESDPPRICDIPGFADPLIPPYGLQPAPPPAARPLEAGAKVDPTRSVREPKCPKCGIIVIDLSRPVCPECGETINWRTPG